MGTSSSPTAISEAKAQLLEPAVAAVAQHEQADDKAESNGDQQRSNSNQ